MPKRKDLNIEMCTLTIVHYQAGKSNSQIAKKWNLNNTTVDYSVKKYRESCSFVNKARSARKRPKTSAEDRVIGVISKTNRRKIAAEINASYRKSASVTTVNRRLYKTVITHT